MSRWPYVPLGELGAGVPHACVGGPFGSDLTTKDYLDSPGVPVIRGSNLGQDCFIDDGFVYVSEQKAQALRQNQARPGDITFTQRGTIGQVAIIPPTARHERYVLSQSQMKLTPDLSQVDPRFLVHYFRSPAAMNFLERNTLATGVPHINLTILRRVPVPRPPLPEQRRIADILDKADAIRRKRKEAIALTEELLRSTFLEMFGDPVTNPKGWKLKPLGEIADVLGGGTPARARPDFFVGPTPWATAKDFKTDLMFDTEEHVSVAAIEASATQIVPPGTILVVVKSKILMRRLPIAVAQVPLCFNQDVKGVLPHDPMDSTYMATHLRAAQREVLKLARGVNTEGLTVHHLRTHPVMRPPVELVGTFTGIESRLRDAAQRATNALQQSEALFQSLVARAFSGRLADTEGQC